MKYRSFVNEVYNSDMKQMLRPWLKEIGDTFASYGMSVQDLDFRTHELFKPTKFSGMNIEFKQQISKGTYNICIAYNNAGGVIAFYSSPSSKDFALDTPFARFGDTSGKYTHIFIAPATAGDVAKIKSRQATRASYGDETEFDRRGKELRRKIANAMKFSDNKDCKEIKNMASRMGFEFKVYTKNEREGMVEIDASISPIFKSVRSDAFSYSISIVNNGGRRVNAEDYCNFGLSVDTLGGAIELGNSYDVNAMANSMNVCGMMCKKAMELVNFINSFTYGDLYVAMD